MEVGGGGVGGEAGGAEVDEFDLYFGVAFDDNVLRFDVTVQQTLRMHKSQCFEHLTRDGAEAREDEVGRLLGLSCPALEFVEVVFEQLGDDDKVFLGGREDGREKGRGEGRVSVRASERMEEGVNEK